MIDIVDIISEYMSKVKRGVCSGLVGVNERVK